MEQFLFDSPQDALESAMRPTKYEQDFKITALAPIYLIIDKGFWLVKIPKSNNRDTYVILLNKSLDKQLWFNWIPTETQIRYLTSDLFKRKITEIENYNDTK